MERTLMKQVTGTTEATVETLLPEKSLLKQLTGTSDATAETWSPKSTLVRLRSLRSLSTLSFSRLSTLTLDGDEEDEEEEDQEFMLVLNRTFYELVPADASHPLRCRSDSDLLRRDGPIPYTSPKDEDNLPAAETETELPDGIPSVGSVYHYRNECKPCAWFWKSAGCANGSSCRHCHLCPEGELMRQRKVHRCMARQRRQDQGTARSSTQQAAFVLPLCPPMLGTSSSGLPVASLFPSHAEEEHEDENKVLQLPL
mmetsp:Transcript_52258/g.122030  ORF Transcript_52258/g.122030 Transcript_52258/m.122030 type:complete len:256 (+) Transcript_52258:110-877(+)